MFSFNIYVYYWEIQIFNFFFMCFNIQGLLQFENVSYGIELLESSTTYEHVIYPLRIKKWFFSHIRKQFYHHNFSDQSYKNFVKSNG